MLIARVVDYELNHYLHAALMSGIQKCLEITQGSVRWIYVCVICNIIAIVAQRRRKERQNPDAGDTEFLEIIKPCQKTRKIADAIVVGIGKCTNVQLIDDGVFIPEWIRRTGYLFHASISGQFVQCSIMRRASHEIYAQA